MSWRGRRPVLKEIHSLSEIPDFETEEEEARFWSTHSLGQELLDAAEPPPPEEMPPVRGRTRPIAIRFDADTVRRLRVLARKKETGYQTLLKTFVQERLYEEEKREGIVG
jgi:hypothetical protein